MGSSIRVGITPLEIVALICKYKGIMQYVLKKYAAGLQFSPEIIEFLAKLQVEEKYTFSFYLLYELLKLKDDDIRFIANVVCNDKPDERTLQYMLYKYREEMISSKLTENHGTAQGEIQEQCGL